MKSNKELREENAELRKSCDELLESDICTFIWSWDMFQENQRLWEELEGLACDLFIIYNMPWSGDLAGYATKEENGKTRIADLGVRKLRRRERKCSI